MKTKIPHLTLGEFRKMYDFLSNKLGEKYCVDTSYEEYKGNLHEFSGAMCIRIFKDDDDKAVIKIFDPTYYKPSRKGLVVIEITMFDDDTPDVKQISLSKFEKKSFFELIEKIINCVLLYPDIKDGDSDDIATQKQNEINLKNEKLIKSFKSWVKKL